MTQQAADPNAGTTEAHPPGDFAEAAEPFALFESWLKDAERHEPNDPNAMALATVDEPADLADIRRAYEAVTSQVASASASASASRSFSAEPNETTLP